MLMNSFNFCLLGKSLFLKDSFDRYSVFFLSVLYIYHSTIFWSARFLLKNPLTVKWGRGPPLYVTCCLSFLVSKCYLCLWPLTIIIMCLIVDFFQLIIFWVFLASFFPRCLFSSPDLENFQSLCLWITFLVLFVSLFPLSLP